MATQGPACKACGHDELRSFYRLEQVPVHSCLLMDTRDEALAYPRGDLDLAFCESCGFIQNQAFDAGLHEYSTRYEETQAFSPRFQRFLDDHIERLISTYDLLGKSALEIGCGKGEWLVRYCELSGGSGVGIDPGYRPERTTSPVRDRLTFHQDFYGPKYAHSSADFVVCRHTLEHIEGVRDFVQLVHETIGGRREALVFFELPDVLRVLDECAFQDFYYEHCSYFTLGSLTRLFRRCGFEPIEVWTDYDEQYLMLTARVASSTPPARFVVENDLSLVKEKLARFEAQAQRRLADWRAMLDAVRAEAGRVVVWGSGSKGVAYLTTLGLRAAHDVADPSDVRYVVDINPNKHGKFLAGTGHEIVAPSFLTEYQPTTIVVMNPIYMDEIAAMCRELGVEAQLIAI